MICAVYGPWCTLWRIKNSQREWIIQFDLSFLLSLPHPIPSSHLPDLSLSTLPSLPLLVPPLPRGWGPGYCRTIFWILHCCFSTLAQKENRFLLYWVLPFANFTRNPPPPSWILKKCCSRNSGNVVSGHSKMRDPLVYISYSERNSIWITCVYTHREYRKFASYLLYFSCNMCQI